MRCRKLGNLREEHLYSVPALKQVLQEEENKAVVNASRTGSGSSSARSDERLDGVLAAGDREQGSPVCFGVAEDQAFDAAPAASKICRVVVAS